MPLVLIGVRARLTTPWLADAVRPCLRPGKQCHPVFGVAAKIIIPRRRCILGRLHSNTDLRRLGAVRAEDLGEIWGHWEAGKSRTGGASACGFRYSEAGDAR